MTALGEWDLTDQQAPDGGEDLPELFFATLDQFVQDQLVQLYRRSLEGRSRIWCPQWWRHAEAIARLEGLWRSWEHLRLDPALGMSTWLRDHADPHMAVLTDPDGPLKGCSSDKGHSARPLPPFPTDPPPAGLFG